MKERTETPSRFLTLNTQPSTLNHSDAEVTRCGGCLQRSIQWVRLPPASLEEVEGRWLSVERKAQHERRSSAPQPSAMNLQPNAGTVDVDRPAAHERLGRVSSRVFRTWVLIERHQRLVSSEEEHLSDKEAVAGSIPVPHRRLETDSHGHVAKRVHPVARRRQTFVGSAFARVRSREGSTLKRPEGCGLR